jgi:hypothetical protein
MKKSLQLVGAVALTLAVGGAQAIPLTDLLAGQSLTAGDKVFDQWEVLFWASSDMGPEPDYALIEVTPLKDGGDDPGPGLNIDFGGQMDVTGDDVYAFKDLTIGFHVSPIGSKKIEDNALTFGDPPSGLSWEQDDLNDLGIAVVEQVLDVDGNLLADKYIEFSILDNEVSRIWPDSAAFAPQDDIFVTKNILVWSVDSTDTAQLGGIQQRFSQTPEPATVLLFGLGLAGAGLARRRKG